MNKTKQNKVVEVPPTKQITVKDFSYAFNAEHGWCSTCGRFTMTNVGLHVEKAFCTMCGQNTLFGANTACVQDLFTIKKGGN